MPLTKYGANFPYTREELLALFTCAQQEDVYRGGRYDAYRGVLNVWSHPWHIQAARDESTLVGSFYVNWLTDRLTQMEWDDGFELVDLLHELALLEERALGAVKHGCFRTGWL
jgi:hypothetical protein